MPVQPVSTTIGALVNNANVLPDGTAATSTSIARVSATGTTQADAAPVSTQLVIVPNNTAANGVILPKGVKGQIIVIYPQLATNAPKVYPPKGGTLAFGAVDANGTATAQAKTAFYCIDDTGLNWI